MVSECPRRRFLAAGGVGAAILFLGRERAFAGLQQPATVQSVADLVADLVAANRILAREQVLDGFGHVSVRHPGTRDHFLLARSVAPALVEPADILEYDLDANPVKAGGPASYKERFIHSEIYRARGDVNAVVHCHTPSLIPFGVTGVPLRPIYHQSAFVADGVPIFEIRRAAGMTDMLIEDKSRGRALAETLGPGPAALMRGHGAVVVGGSIPTVVGRSVYLDMNARLQAQAMALGGPITYLEPDEARLYNASNNYDRAWDLWKRELQ